MPSMSSLVPPVAIPYAGLYNTIPLQTNLRPNNKPKANQEAYVPLQMDWSQLIVQAFPGSSNLCVLVNTGLSPNSLDFIRCLVIDNSYCEFDIHLQFLDGFTLTIPAWEPLDVYPVLTNQLAFFVWCDSPTPVTAPSPILAGRHSTTNIFACNANIPPIRAKQIRKQNYTFLGISANGTYNLAGTPPTSANVYSNGLLLRGIIIGNASAYNTGGVIGLQIQIDGNPFFQADFFGNAAYTDANPSMPVVMPDLNIRCGLVTAIVSSGSIVSMVLALTVIFIDHTGGYALT